MFHCNIIAKLNSTDLHQNVSIASQEYKVWGLSIKWEGNNEKKKKKKKIERKLTVGQEPMLVTMTTQS